MNQVDIILWLKCNEKCNFCFQDSDYIKKHDKNFSKTEVLKALILWRKMGINMVNISWGEPTIYENNFNFVLRLSNKLWYKTIKVITNWIKFSDIIFSSDNLPYITDIGLSFHSSQKEIQDKLTWLKWSYDSLIIAIKNIKSFSKVYLHNHCVITNENLLDLENHIKNIIFLWFKSIHFMSLMHNTEKNKNKTYDFDQLVIILKNIINKYNKKIRIEVSYIQPCYLKWYEDYVLWFDYWKDYISNNVESLKSWESTMNLNKEFKKECYLCNYLNTCNWFWKK